MSYIAHLFLPYIKWAFIIGYLYWPFMAPWYRMYSIEKLENKEKYYLWKKLSTNYMILWPDNFIWTKYELWNDKRYNNYKSKLRNLGV